MWAVAFIMVTYGSSITQTTLVILSAEGLLSVVICHTKAACFQ